MRRALLPLLIVAAIVVAVASAWLTLTRGGGRPAEIVTEEVGVEPFRRLDASGQMDVTLIQGDKESVVVELAGDGGTGVRIRQDAGALAIGGGGEPRRWWQSLLRGRAASTPRVTVTFRALDAISLSGSVKLAADRVEVPQLRISASGGSTVRIDNLQASALKLAGSGALKATIAGKVEDEDISISGAGDVRADKLVSDHARVSVSGAGNIVVNARKTLLASISGAGSVDYYGNPDVKQEVSGVGRIRQREALVQ